MSTEGLIIKVLFDEYLKFAQFIGKRRSASQDFDCAYDEAFSAASQALVDSGISPTDVQDTGVIAKIAGRIPMSWLNFPGTITIFIRKEEEFGVNVLVGTELPQVTDYGKHEELIEQVLNRMADYI
jgi:hypothetical protein